MTTESAVARRRELGEFVRSHRERLTPEMVGLPGGGRRRTPGLRREEVAQLAGLSVTWYVWIEQGRDVSASTSALSRLARALRLSKAERAYLFERAGKADPLAGADAASPLGPSLLACVDVIAWPAYLLDRYWTAIAWNMAAASLFVGWLDGEHDRNLLRYVFQSPAARTLICDFEDRARRVLAEFRIDYGRHLDDPAMRDLVEQLSHESPSFSRAWNDYSVVAREGGKRSFAHPDRGLAVYEQLSFALAGHPDVKLVILGPVSARAETKP
ncbi:MAG TPA: helix-turn-helix transcriptional regulator [Beijerinckiaceae bacterium]|nr:helix-turn-helix transcriptional regulator [Beijerinckiaceae bacterium]